MACPPTPCSRSWKSRSSQMNAGLKSVWPAAAAAPRLPPPTPARSTRVALV
jgi:hypothetical protein